jgi:hypothetical protein
MVLKFTKLGNPYREPPYTEEEEDELDRRISRIVAFTRPSGTAKLQPQQQSAASQQAERRRDRGRRKDRESL